MTDNEKLKLLIRYVKDVREAQKAYFAAKKSNQLCQADINKLLSDPKSAERRLDDFIRQIENLDTQQRIL